MATQRTVLITGGSRGIGRATARIFAAAGWRVALTYRRDAAAANSVVGAITGAGGRAEALPCDVAREASIVDLFGRLDGAGIRLDAVVNNAGITGPRTRLADLDAGTLHDVVAVNLCGAILVAREAAKRLSTARGGAGGTIINLSSTATRQGSPDQWVHYAATKGAIDVLTNGLARELAAEGIRVNAVAPGLTLGDPSQRAAIEARLAELAHEIPMARAGTAEEVAQAILWLCGDQASYVTGVVLPVAGGR